jgi:hypothetical protein
MKYPGLWVYLRKFLACGFEAANVQNLICADQVSIDIVQNDRSYRHSGLAGQPGKDVRKAQLSFKKAPSKHSKC